MIQGTFHSDLYSDRAPEVSEAPKIDRGTPWTKAIKNMSAEQEEKAMKPINFLAIPDHRIIDGVVFYVVRARGGSGQWLCQKRYSQFEALQMAISSKHALPLGTELPPKRWSLFVSHTSPAFIEERRVLLENFIRRLLADSSIGNSTTFVDFFKADIQQEDTKISQKENEAKLQGERLPDDIEITGVIIPATRKMSDHVLYQIDLENNKKRLSFSKWTVLKRYGQIWEMDQAVRVDFQAQPNVLAAMPILPARQPKLFMAHMSDAFIESRRVLLETYFSKMLRIIPVVRNKNFLMFLGVIVE